MNKDIPDSGHTIQTGPKKAWVIPSPEDSWHIYMNMISAGNFADWKNFFLMPVNYLKIFRNKIERDT